ncbi:MAG: TIGR01459 family HAD-type hydrolase [Granulosicoccus sp.]
MVTPVFIDSVDELCSEYDLFLFDQYGVLHNGQDSYSGMVDCLSRIKDAGKQIAVISNSGKRANYNAQRLAEFGFTSELIDEVVSSGEVAYSILYKSLPKKDRHTRVLYLGRGSDRSAIVGLPAVETIDSQDADLIIITGSEPDKYSLEHYAKYLEAAAHKGIQALCTNPDKWSLVGFDLEYGPGQIADLYASMGGQVSWIGKPYSQIYDYALDLFDVPPDRVVGIGDSIEHDVGGAKAAGVASVLTATGILVDLDIAALDSLYQQHGAVPNYLVRR